MDIVYAVYISPYLYFVFVTHNIIHQKRKKNITVVDTMYGNTLLSVTKKACVSPFQLLLQ